MSLHATPKPTLAETLQAKQSLESLSQNGDIRNPDGSPIPIPASVRALLTVILKEVSLGHSVTLVPSHSELTTQQAADFLNVSRPYLVKLLEAGVIPFHMVGTHRRVRFDELLKYQTKIDLMHEQAMDFLVEQAQELGLGY